MEELNIDELDVRWNFNFQITLADRHNIWPNESVTLTSESTYEDAEIKVLEQLLKRYPGCSNIEIRDWGKKVITPTWIQSKMKLWREGLLGEFEGEWGFPKSYTEFHTALARRSLDELTKVGYVVHSEFIQSDGWGDGFNVVHAIVENKRGHLFKLKWSDTNQGWMRCYPNHCGAGYFDYNKMVDWHEEYKSSGI
jgi:hypothetical protein